MEVASSIFCLVLTIVFWGVSMRTAPPFSQGQTLGWGFLIGGVAAFLALLLARRFAHKDGNKDYVAPHATGLISECFLGLAAVSLAFILFRGNPQWALMGVAVGAALGCILSLCLPSRGRYVFSFAVVCITMAAAVIFAIRHVNETTLRMWWPIPLLVGLTSLVAACVGVAIQTSLRSSTSFENNETGQRNVRLVFLSTCASAAVALVLNAIYSWKLVADWRLFYTVAISFGAACLIGWMAVAASRPGGVLFRASAASALLIAALVVAGFTLWAGLGISVGLLAAWAVTIPVVVDDSSRRSTVVIGVVRGLLLIGLAMLLFRLFIELYGPVLRTTDLRIHYTFIGAVLGAMMPVVLMTGVPREGTGNFSVIVRVASLGLIAAVAPLVLLLVWGIKALMGLVFGLIAALVLSYIGRPEDEAPSSSYLAQAALVLGAQLTAIVFAAPFVAVELTRSQRVWILIIAAAVAVAWFLVSCAPSRRTTA